jgi:YidC/Oxa1 family membrane protein insertase
MTANPRVLVWIALALVLWLNWDAWMRDYAPAAPSAPAASSTQQPGQAPTVPATKFGDAVPQAATPSASGADKTSQPAASPGSAPSPPAAGGVAAAPAGGEVHVRTDVLDLDINLEGGTFDRVDLLRYPQVKGQSELVRLMNTKPDTLYLLQTGLTGPADGARPNHLASFTSPQNEYTLGSASELRVPLVWTDGNGVTVTKNYIFKPGSYRIDLEYVVDNKSGAAWQAAPYAQILRRDPVTKRSMFTTNVENYSFHGPAIWDGTKYRKLKIADEEDKHLSIDVKNGWIASLQHHFVGAVVPPKDASWRVTLAAEGQEYRLAAAGPVTTVAPGQTAKLDETLFVGPKLQAQLEKTGPELDRVADYGKLTLLAKPLFWLLQQVHTLFGNWGWAIITVTFLLKLLFYPLSETSGRSMAKMKMLSPRIKALQESYKDDREKLGRAMMDLYKREKVNPVAGCLPMVIQIPVFLAFYWVLLESVEMRQAPFMGWINDLSSKDPYFVLPAIMAGAMFMQYKLQGTPGADPVQQKVFMFMPFVMSFMFAFFPSGLVLYWVTNTLLSIAQQWNINRRINASKKS